MVDISGIEKRDLLKALWMNSNSASFFTLSGTSPPDLSEKDIDKAIEKRRIDYLCGRVIKMDISGDTVDPWNYDRNNGNGSVQKIVNVLK